MGALDDDDDDAVVVVLVVVDYDYYSFGPSV